MAGFDEDSSSDDGLTDLAAWNTTSHPRPAAASRKSQPAPRQSISISEVASEEGAESELAGDDIVPEQDADAEDVEDDHADDETMPDTIPAHTFKAINARPRTLDDVKVMIPAYERNLDDFEDLRALATRVSEVMGVRTSDNKAIVYNVLFEDTHSEEIQLRALLALEGGKEAYAEYNSTFRDVDRDDTFASESETRMSLSRPNAKRLRDNYADLDALDAAIEADDRGDRRSKRPRIHLTARRPDDSNDEIGFTGLRRKTRQTSSLHTDSRPGARLTRASRLKASPASNDDVQVLSDSSADEIGFLTSDIKPKRPSRATGVRKRASYVSPDGTVYDRPPKSKNSTRHSGRSTRHQGAMEEVGEDQIHRSDSDKDKPAPPPKAVGVKEKFQALPRTDLFRNRHIQQCDTCTQGINFAPLIYCQGCTFAYHKSCIRERATREHLVTKVGPDDFVLQCRRCVRFVQRKEVTAPDQAKCLDCKIPGPACKPFRQRKTTAQEQKEREMNSGEDPICSVPRTLINNPVNVLFRCTGCYRACHFEHLPPRFSDLMETDTESLAAQRFAEYSKDWKCQECETAPTKAKGLVAWKPVDEDSYDPTKSIDEISEDDKAYLVRWEGKSYFRATWMPGPWVWGVTASMMRRSFARRDDAQVPKMRTEDAIPEEYLRTDIVLDVRYTSIVDVKGEEIDKARIREVKEALIKFKGLGYEDAVWEIPPIPEDQDRWSDFVKAYNDYVMGRYVHVPKAQPLKTRLEKVRAKDFAKDLEKKKQPDLLVGGELMKYQLEGVNWLYYKWYSQKNAILADEMGLGKTIQIIGLMATLVSDHNTYPFLVVVPNATCANWRREIKLWAPGLRVVAWFGSAAARDLAYRHELYPNGTKDLAAHIVVTSYDAAQDDPKRFLRSVPWQALIVDEGQRLKSDKTILYNALTQLKVPFRILLTGTPLQNNARELFNLLQFLDDGYDAAQMENEYENLDNEKVARLHDLIRPFFLRRTKAQVLTFLPPMAQIIVPVSMSLVQKKLYRSILAKNPDLLRALFKEKRDLKGNEKGSLNNILMQLRKCLCHPFVYNKGIEERNVANSISHRNLVEASGKLQLLEILLPKLKERGHRVLLFSQFLDMLTMVEDFLDGLGMQYHRLDGTMGSLQKQKRIDDFNAPDSEYFAFLLSTRAGGVGINLATADTVIILDPDFNPHQDIQALSRAHRIGQKKKVLCFQLVTRASAEEKIIQIGRGKMALDHVLIEQMDAEDASDQDLQSILLHGSNELFNDDGDKDIKYDASEIDKLLDRSQMEDTKAGEDKSAESQFSFARVWAGNGLEDTMRVVEAEDQAPNPDVWEKILKERERAAAAEAAAAKEAFGRGRRTKQMVDYGPTEQEVLPPQDLAAEIEELKGLKKTQQNDDDTDFQAETDIESVASDSEPASADVDSRELADGAGKKKKTTPKIAQGIFRRVNVTQPLGTRTYTGLPTPPGNDQPNIPSHYISPHHLPVPANPYFYGPSPSTVHFAPIGPQIVACLACHNVHAQGSCPLKKAGLEKCNLCGLAHFGHARICPHINSETQVRAMLDALKQSPEAGNLVKEARKYLAGVKGTLVQKKKQEEERRKREAAEAQGMVVGRVDEDRDLVDPVGWGQQQQHQQGGDWRAHPAAQ